MPNHPLAEVFGYPITNQSADAKLTRDNRLCPFHNRVPRCTKDKADNPLGTCCVFGGNDVIVTCPIRFTQNWLIAADAANFFFSPDMPWTSLEEVRLDDAHGKAAGNIDYVLAAYDSAGKVVDFGALEVQAVYISGNIRTPFEYYMADPSTRMNMDWIKEPNFPRPDFLSSSRKRLAPQLIYKGGILKAWNKKTAVVMDSKFLATLPTLRQVEKDDADIAWLVYDLVMDEANNTYRLTRNQIIYTTFEESLNQITKSEVGSEANFVKRLQDKLDKKLNGSAPPDAPPMEVTF